jgi:hypothetical protein
MDEGGFVVDYIMPAGSSLTETNRVLEHVDRILHSIPEIEAPLAALDFRWALPP